MARRSLLKGPSRPKTPASTPPPADAPAEEEAPAPESTDAAAPEEAGDAPVEEDAAEDTPEEAAADAPEEAAAEEGPDQEGHDDASSMVEPLGASTVPTEPEGSEDRQNLADTQVETSPAEEADETSESDKPLSRQATKPPAPRQELPPGLANMQTPIRPDRQEPEGSPLPANFNETPMGAGWYVGTGQPLPARDAVPGADTPVVTRKGGVPVPIIVGGVIAVLMVVCAGIWAVAT